MNIPIYTQILLAIIIIGVVFLTALYVLLKLAEYKAEKQRLGVDKLQEMDAIRRAIEALDGGDDTEILADALGFTRGSLESKKMRREELMSELKLLDEKGLSEYKKYVALKQDVVNIYNSTKDAGSKNINLEPAL